MFHNVEPDKAAKSALVLFLRVSHFLLVSL